MPRRVPSRAWALRVVLCGGLVLSVPVPASASGEGGGSDSNSKGSGNSSDGSKDSSNTSDGTSDDSRGSSRNSDDSTKNSPKNSTDYTSDGSTDWTTHSRGGQVFSVALAVVAVGGLVVGLVATNRAQNGQQQATAALAGFMRRQHALLTRDIAMAEGPVLDAWAHDLRLTATERRRLRQTLEGSIEQGALLEALDGPIDGSRARQFGAAFLRVTDRALGRQRAKTLVLRAVRATGG
jgi:hypothetical protein